MREYGVWFTDLDGSTNHKILEAHDILAVMVYMMQLGLGNSIIKIERR